MKICNALVYTEEGHFAQQDVLIKGDTIQAVTPVGGLAGDADEVTVDGTGMYSGDAKNVLFCVVSRKEIVLVKDIVSKIDRNSFVIVTDAREVYGEGFIENRQ